MVTNQAKWYGRWVSAVLVGCAVAAPAACHHFSNVHHAPAPSTGPRPATTQSSVPVPVPLTTAPAPATSAADVSFTDSKSGLALRYPADWKPRADADYVLMLVPAASDADRHISFDVPDLPPHFPGMIKVGLIENGYLDDLKKKHAGLKVEESADHPMPKAKARLVRSTWQESGRSFTDVALLVMHGERVYILSADSDAAAFSETKTAFDKITDSIAWTR